MPSRESSGLSHWRQVIFVYCVDLDPIGHGEGPLVVLWSETPRLLTGSARWSQQMLHSLPPPGFP